MLESISAVLAALAQPFRFFHHARQRRLDETREMHERQMQMLEAVMARGAEQSKHQTEAIVEMSKAQQSQSAALAKWFDLFQANMGEGESHTIRPADEAADAEERELAELRKKYPIHASAPEQMAWLRENTQ